MLDNHYFKSETSSNRGGTSKAKSSHPSTRGIFILSGLPFTVLCSMQSSIAVSEQCDKAVHASKLISGTTLKKIIFVFAQKTKKKG